MQGKTILLVDDDLAFSDMLSEILSDEGATVYVAHDGVQGLEEAQRLTPDLIMCDVMMPRMSGIEVLTSIRDTEWGSTVPFILLTNMNEPEALSTLDVCVTNNTECLLKTDWTLDALAKKITGLLADAA